MTNKTKISLFCSTSKFFLHPILLPFPEASDWSSVQMQHTKDEEISGAKTEYLTHLHLLISYLTGNLITV